MADYKELVREVRSIADSGYADYCNRGYPNSDELRKAASVIEALQARVTTLQYEVDAIADIKAERDALSAKLAEQPTARTYMEGYSDGKAWALEEAAKVCDSKVNEANQKGEAATSIKARDIWSAVAQKAHAIRTAIRKLKEAV